MTQFEIFIYALLWLSFGILHSLLARNSVKRKLEPLLGRCYRITYNLFSAVHIGIVIIGGQIMLGSNSAESAMADSLVTLALACQISGIVVIGIRGQYTYLDFDGLRPARLGASGLPVNCSRLWTNSAVPSGRPVRV